jgi:signal transduction histidine kinase
MPLSALDSIRIVDEPTVGSLPRVSTSVGRSSRGADIESIFLRFPDYPGVLVHDDDKLPRVLSRRVFSDVMSRPFSRDLFLKRPVTDLLQRCLAETLCLNLREPIDTAVAKALARDPISAYEPVVIEEPDRSYAIMEVDTILPAQSVVLEAANAEKDRLLEKVRLSELELRQTLERLEETQELLIHSEKMAALGQLVAGVAHEIDTPIGVALTSASFLSERTNEIDKALGSGTMKRSVLQEFLGTALESSQIIQSNIRRAAKLIQSFKQLAVDQTSEARRGFGAKAFLDELATSISHEFKRSAIELRIDCPVDFRSDCYPGALAQVITNLVANAKVHAFDEGSAGRIEVSLTDAGNDCVLVVSDDGRGIPQEALPKIFEPFYTTKRGSGGTGLGLQITHNLVTETLRGKIEVTSEVGQGSSFRVVIPRQ